MILTNHETFMVMGFVKKKGRNICELMGMVIYELKKELISESRVENSKIDGDFETISSPLASREA